MVGKVPEEGTAGNWSPDEPPPRDRPQAHTRPAGTPPMTKLPACLRGQLASAQVLWYLNGMIMYLLFSHMHWIINI